MPSYLITGVSRGLGFGFLKVLSADKNNTIIGLVRDKKSTDAKVKEQLGDLDNVTILQADMLDYAALKAAVPVVEKITGGKLDYIIANAAWASPWSAFRSIDSLAKEPEKLEEDYVYSFRVNVVGNVHLLNLFIPLVLKGDVKKVIHIASGQSSVDMIAKHDISIMTPYAASKSAMNIVTSKFSGFYREQGVLFLSVAPGSKTSTDQYPVTDEIKANMASTGDKFKRYAPHFERDFTPEESVKEVLSVVERSSIGRGDAGQFVSQFGNQQWL
ncbi:uncharacterized protein NECHADRAFT_48385 [Fusarium vanettenii 77-13-4]|uniref:NAD(P)-binding protein n=1 Tax=Fusarium vanettenii (strain ATCC MYA-4622 / CBS 123669 / FGSC 9596 / NRRL 45880 / 77-13-4) TaxID=660122 RepID=C7ZCR5_FUSV7|nr:uncharacterized protein NECHADRAFT_48385 [Fusarium vanettenii 77-13-4]EEU38088.1 hypothetical protein NECHADRAFT_48385 [Fusarium vanettenii 77-13-4]